jgi:signal transduction histidine kinase
MNETTHATPRHLASTGATDRRLLSSLRLKVTLTLFILALLLGMSTLVFVLVMGVFDRFDGSLREDLGWKAVRGASEVAQAAELGLASADEALTQQAFDVYRRSPDVAYLVATDPQGKVVAAYQDRPFDLARLFGGSPRRLRGDDRFLWSWDSAHIDSATVGRVGIVVALSRLAEAHRLRRRMMVIAGMGCLAALALSFFFVNYYLGPLIRFSEQTLLELRSLNANLETRVQERTTELQAAYASVVETNRKSSEMQRQLVEASRRAGMADVATTVLHNVGNVLNSVNASSDRALEMIRGSQVKNLGKVGELLRANQQDLGPFFDEHPKGRKLLPFLGALEAAVESESAIVTRELESLQRNVDHIKVIVSRQQDLAKAQVGVVETVVLGDLIDDAIRFNEASYDRHGLEVRREFAELAPIRIDRHKLFQILMNLLSNARHAVKDQPDGERRVTLRLCASQGDRVRLEVEDTGCGIPAENMEKIFIHGFTTKEHGHGFGLHSSACATVELGGSLLAHSDGPGRGARFTLEVPTFPARQPATMSAGATLEAEAIA